MLTKQMRIEVWRTWGRIPNDIDWTTHQFATNVGPFSAGRSESMRQSSGARGPEILEPPELSKFDSGVWIYLYIIIHNVIYISCHQELEGTRTAESILCQILGKIQSINSLCCFAFGLPGPRIFVSVLWHWQSDLKNRADSRHIKHLWTIARLRLQFLFFVSQVMRPHPRSEAWSGFWPPWLSRHGFSWQTSPVHPKDAEIFGWCRWSHLRQGAA